MSTPIVDLIVEHDAWTQALPDLQEVVEQGAQMAISVLPKEHRAASICVMACDDARIAELNAQFREKPQATNVLSWPAFDLSAETAGGTPDLPPASDPVQDAPFLGDVAIALQTVVQEADAASKPLKNHVLHLILHGSLHLLGYDHVDAEDAEVMEGLETRMLRAAGHPDPYA